MARQGRHLDMAANNPPIAAKLHGVLLCLGSGTLDWGKSTSIKVSYTWPFFNTCKHHIVIIWVKNYRIVNTEHLMSYITFVICDIFSVWNIKHIFYIYIYTHISYLLSARTSTSVWFMYKYLDYHRTQKCSILVWIIGNRSHPSKNQPNSNCADSQVELQCMRMSCIDLAHKSCNMKV